MTNKKYRPWSMEEKMRYSKRFSKNERIAYRKGKRNGWLNHYHATKKNTNDFMRHKYSKKDFDSIFDDINKVKLV